MSLVLFLMVGWLCSRFSRSELIFAAAAASFIVLPTLHLIRARRAGQQTYELAQTLAQHGVYGNIASDGNWNETLYIVSDLQARFYGSLAGRDLQTMDRECKQFGIQYFLVWDDSVAAT